MNVVRTLLNIGDVYDKVVVEGKHYTFAPKGTFKTATDKKPVEAKADPKAFTPKKSGPENADGFKKDLIDPEKAKADNLLGIYKRPVGNLNDFEDAKSQRYIR